MAYSRKILCLKCYCGITATHEVLNAKNSIVGLYCKSHAAKKVEELKAREAGTVGP